MAVTLYYVTATQVNSAFYSFRDGK